MRRVVDNALACANTKGCIMLHSTRTLGFSYSRLKTHADAFLRQHAIETGSNGSLLDRLRQVQDEIERTGTYEQSTDELAHGARVAWRNSTRCIGRLFWHALEVRDLRHLTTAEEVFDACVEHLRLATNHGRIRAMITVFAPQTPGKPGIRIWNPQLIRYAGYRQPDGRILGDPAHIHLTDYLLRLGWEAGERTPFDVLPLIIQTPGRHPQIFDLPRDAVLEVPIRHPTYSWFQTLGLKWHALPVISNMRLEIGGISYAAAPFNGWYMGTEIGARNFGDSQRYDLLPVIADKLGIPMRSKETLWKDRALVELNVAVLHSFRLAGVKLVDHHTAARQFLQFEEQERKARRKVFGEWAWLVPPLSSSAVETFHRPYENRVVSPNFFEQPVPWHIADLNDGSEQDDGSTGERLAHPKLAHGSAAKCPFDPAADTGSAA